MVVCVQREVAIRHSPVQTAGEAVVSPETHTRRNISLTSHHARYSTHAETETQLLLRITVHIKPDPILCFYTEIILSHNLSTHSGIHVHTTRAHTHHFNTCSAPTQRLLSVARRPFAQCTRRCQQGGAL